MLLYLSYHLNIFNMTLIPPVENQSSVKIFNLRPDNKHNQNRSITSNPEVPTAKSFSHCFQCHHHLSVVLYHPYYLLSSSLHSPPISVFVWFSLELRLIPFLLLHFLLSYHSEDTFLCLLWPASAFRPPPRLYKLHSVHDMTESSTESTYQINVGQDVVEKEIESKKPRDELNFFHITTPCQIPCQNMPGDMQLNCLLLWCYSILLKILCHGVLCSKSYVYTPDNTQNCSVSVDQCLAGLIHDPLVHHLPGADGEGGLSVHCNQVSGWKIVWECAGTFQLLGSRGLLEVALSGFVIKHFPSSYILSNLQIALKTGKDEGVEIVIDPLSPSSLPPFLSVCILQIPCQLRLLWTESSHEIVVIIIDSSSKSGLYSFSALFLIDHEYSFIQFLNHNLFSLYLVYISSLDTIKNTHWFFSFFFWTILSQSSASLLSVPAPILTLLILEFNLNSSKTQPFLSPNKPHRLPVNILGDRPLSHPEETLLAMFEHSPTTPVLSLTSLEINHSYYCLLHVFAYIPIDISYCIHKLTNDPLKKNLGSARRFWVKTMLSQQQPALNNKGNISVRCEIWRLAGCK
ncbi:hypothetical protein VP01_609g1 [Puccinia sorghi]|uniref:Uncharacterized protein n=1 Tax=Puccinia sorghi TaxID=27349 RepID=A0A0L6UH54_9BASI|nr:hypothetical protein VP01_609g1 [Puccinia sorghi]